MLIFAEIQKNFALRIQYINYDNYIIPKYPKISLPPVNILENNTIHVLMEIASNSLLNRKTGHYYFLIITVDKERVKFAIEQFCSLIQTGFPKSCIIYISFDEESCSQLRNVKATCVAVNINQIPLLNVSHGKYHMKIYLLYLQNWWGLDAYTLDSDIIFFDHIENAFYNNNTDIEMSSNDCARVSQIDVANSKQHNSGFGRFLPTKASRKIINEIWDTSLKMGDRRDQIIHYFVYSGWRGKKDRIINGIEIWRKKKLTAKFRIIDPLKVANGGVAMCRGRKDYWYKINIQSHIKYKMPVALHFNWDVFDKYLTYKWLGLKMCKKYNKRIVKKFKTQILHTNCVSKWGCPKCYIETTKEFIKKN